MSNLDPLASNARNPWAATTGPGSPASAPTGNAPSVGSSATSPEVSYDAAVSRLPIPMLDLGAVVARMDPVATKLDVAKSAASGPYTVNGATVTSGAQFRISNGYNEADRLANQATLLSVASSIGLSTEQLARLQEGRGESAALTKLTQALIDTGHLETDSKTPVADQIHNLQWRFGIGMDCAGYVYLALTKVHGDPAKLGVRPIDLENFTGLPRNPNFSACAASDARAGDVVVLQGDPNDAHDPGHNLIVRSHSTLNDITNPGLAAGTAAHAFAFDSNQRIRPGIQMFEVDSSFSAHEHGDASGGVRRDILLYNPNATPPNAKWCTCKSTTPPETTFNHVPYDEHALIGFFRPKGTP